MSPTPVKQFSIDSLSVNVFQSNSDCGWAAAVEAQKIIHQAIQLRGIANLILATGNSQITFLEHIQKLTVDWQKVNIFHMDEYIGLSSQHPASFPLFLKKHLIDRIKPRCFFSIQPNSDHPQETCDAYSVLLRENPADLCVLGIGENGHIAFNDPPYAMFDDPLLVKVVKLDERSRTQQVGEGHFRSLSEVPTHAITLTIPALRAAARMLCIVPEKRKAEAVRKTLLGPISEDCPASILRQTSHCQLLLDIDSASEVNYATQSHS